MKFPTTSKKSFDGLVICLSASSMTLAETTKTMTWITLGTHDGPNIRVFTSTS